MNFLIFLKEYFFWHYGAAIADIIGLWKNFLWFGYHQFSFALLWKTLFSPFYRIVEKRKRGFEAEEFMENFVANAVSRLVGLILRIFVLAAGLVFEIFIFVSAPPALILWLFLPAFPPLLLIYGAFLLF